MRVRFFAISLLTLTPLAGCATVSMMPGEALVETEVTSEQSQLREVCDAYVAQTHAEHWVTPSGGFLDFAKVLIDGESGKDARLSYEEYIEADTADPSNLFVRIAADIEAASIGLEVVTEQANLLIAAGPSSKSSLRRDIVSFESALVAGQKARRSFAEAISIVAERSQSDIELAEAALAKFDLVLDTTRGTADALALAQTSEPVATS